MWIYHSFIHSQVDRQAISSWRHYEKSHHNHSHTDFCGSIGFYFSGTHLGYLLGYMVSVCLTLGFPGGSVVKNPLADTRDVGLIPGSGKIPWRRKCQSTPVFLLWKSHGQRSLADYSPWGNKQLVLTEQLSTNKWDNPICNMDVPKGYHNGCILGEVSQIEKDKYMVSLTCGI